MNIKMERERLRKLLQGMDDFDFEFFVADIWEKQGWDTEVEQQSGDAGVDIRATKSSPYPEKQLIQAKRYSESNKVGGPDIQQYASLKQQEQGVDAAVIVTTSSFTRSAKERAADLNVKLVDVHDLVSIIEEVEAEELIYDYNDIESEENDSTKVVQNENDREDINGVTAEDTTSQISVINIPFIDIEYEKNSTPKDANLTKTRRYYAIWGGVILWIISVVLSSSVAELAALMMIVGWVLTPLAIALDIRSVGVLSWRDMDWWVAIVGSAIPIIGIVPTALYLSHRRGMRLDKEQARLSDSV